MAAFANLLVPSGKKFYDLFDAVVKNLVSLTSLFGQVIAEPLESKRRQILMEIGGLEHENDQLTHRLFLQLGRNFITPFDREDIHHLASHLDDIADFTWGAARQMSFMKLQANNVTHSFAKLQHGIVIRLAGIVNNLRDTATYAQIATDCRALIRVLDSSSKLVDDALIQLFTAREEDVKLLIKRLDHYEMLHSIVEKTSKVIKTIEVAAIKYG